MSESTCPIVGIGASAGGLDALKGLFQALPGDTGAAFVVIQHLDPTHESLTAEILSRSTAMPAVQVSNGMPVEPNHVYVIPPNTYLTLTNNTFQLDKPVLRHGLRMPIDTFLWSLAKQHEERAIAIIVSGTGSDGTLGLRAIKGGGGLVLAQSPDTAQYDGMPRSAIATGLVDVTCAVEEMPKYLTGYLHHSYIIEPTHSAESAPVAKDDAAPLGSILALLQTRTGHDFRVYKQGTLSRRIARRMGLHHIDTMADYLTFLRDQEDEATRLFSDLLIGVTAFFRDTEAFEALERDVIVPLVQSKHTDEAIRIWVPGCASGEEAYSVAMMLIEQLESAHKHCPIQVFASDIDESALSVGRTGLYPENIVANLSPERLGRFFTREDHNYRVNKSLRDSITFATQNLISDPPFSNLDLISCRNLLIYLNADVQRKVLALFHFALRENGYLYLGHSETTGQQEELFEPLAKKWRIYRRANATRPSYVDFPIGSRPSHPISMPSSIPAQTLAAEQVRFSEITQQHLLQEFAPAAVLVNRKHQVLHFSGSTSRYLEQPSGAPTQDLLTLARHELRAKLRIALRRVAAEHQRIIVEDAHVVRDGVNVRAKISLKPLKVPRLADALVLITFEDHPGALLSDNDKKVVATGSDASLIQQMEDELHITREDLQSNIEELESANEELQAANEEVMSVNEELQSTNEEMETSKEELQSMNEELTTVNNQYKEKVEELAKSNDDLSNLLSSTDIATLFVDTKLRIGRFTPATQRLLNLISTDAGRPLSDIRPRFSDPGLLDEVQKVLDKLSPLECEVTTEDGEYYLRRILPYRTKENRITGAVITFIDISERKRAEEHTQLLAAVVRDSNDAITLLNLDGQITAWNSGAQKVYGWSEQEALKMTVQDLVPEPERKQTVELIRRIASGEVVHSAEGQRLTKDGRVLDMWLTLTPLINQAGRVISLATTERDISERKRLEKELRDSEANFRALVESAPDALVIVNAKGAVEVANTQAEHLFGYRKDELPGMKVEMLIPKRFRTSHVTARKGFFAHPKLREMGSSMELFALTKGKVEIPIEVSLSPIQTNHGPVVSAAIRDITERKLTDEALRTSKIVADSALAAKSRFLATASHDLRQPLHSLTLLNKALLKAIDEPEAKKMLTMQGRSLSSMAQLLNSLLEISKLESGTVAARMADIPMASIFELMRAEFEVEAHEKNLELKIDATSDIVRSDPGLLAQLIQNLVANAIRYTEEGLVELSCVHYKDRLRIEVRDSGAGIPPDQLTQIFDEFHQIDRDPQERHGGLGLGLAIVQHIATLLGTSVDVVSNVGSGSTFSITVPLSKAKIPEPVEREAEGNQVVTKGGAILLIDDDPAVLESSQMLLSMEQGFEITTASSPPEAYAVLDHHIPDLIVTDFHLSHDESGIDIIRTARARAGHMIPAILVTGDTSPSTGECQIENMQCMTKPIDVEKLVSEIRRLLFDIPETRPGSS